jgi:hypothetical protein
MTDATTDLDAQAAFSGTREVDPRYALDEASWANGWRPMWRASRAR